MEIEHYIKTFQPKKPQELLGKGLLCAFNIREVLMKRFPKRSIHPDSYCPNDRFYYFGVDGHVRMVDTKNWSIWVCDNEHGFPWMKRVRPR